MLTGRFQMWDAARKDGGFRVRGQGQRLDLRPDRAAGRMTIRRAVHDECRHGHKPLSRTVCHGISRGFCPMSLAVSAKETMLRTVKSQLTLAPARRIGSAGTKSRMIDKTGAGRPSNKTCRSTRRSSEDASTPCCRGIIGRFCDRRQGHRERPGDLQARKLARERSGANSPTTLAGSARLRQTGAGASADEIRALVKSDEGLNRCACKAKFRMMEGGWPPKMATKERGARVRSKDSRETVGTKPSSGRPMFIGLLLAIQDRRRGGFAFGHRQHWTALAQLGYLQV